MQKQIFVLYLQSKIQLGKVVNTGSNISPKKIYYLSLLL